MRWRDRARKDLKKFGIEERSWYRVAQEEGSWRKRCRGGLEDATEKIMQEDEMRKRRKAAELSSEVSSSQPGEATALPFKYDTCQRAFRCRQDIARHRCVTTHPKGQGLQFELCVKAICSICLWQRSISPRGGPLSRSRCVCVGVTTSSTP